MASLQSRAHDADISGAVKGVITSTIGHLNQLLLDSLVLQIGRVDEIRGAELLRPGLLAWVQVNDDDLPALFWTAPCTTDRPTQPAPKTATLEPSSTLAVSTAAPYPVVMPQPSRQVRSMGASLVMATTEMSATTVYWEKVEVPMKWSSSFPLHLNLEVPSGITPLPWVALILPQRLVLPDLQNLHSLHSGVLCHSTISSVREENSGLGWKVGLDLDSLKSDNVVSWLDGGHTLADGFDDTSSLVSKHNGESSLRVLCRRCMHLRCGFRSAHWIPMMHLLQIFFSIHHHSEGDVPVWQTPV